MKLKARDRNRGAAMVEFALVLPVLVLLLFGVIEFTRAYNAKTTMTHAAREGARTLALRGTVADAQARVRATSPSLNQANLTITTTPASGTCTPGQTVSVVLSYRMPYSIPMFRSGEWSLKETGVMRCGG
jgi:Flp pilus assembly protein TadG